jgi:hypothetical protein
MTMTNDAATAPATTVRLETQTGEFVADVGLPPFDPLPEVVIWGSRFFVLAHTQHNGGAWYCEALAYFAPCPMPARRGKGTHRPIVITAAGFAALRAYENAGGGLSLSVEPYPAEPREEG